LNRHGYSVLAIDFRGHGESSASSKSFGLFESDDASAALDWLRRANPGSQLGVIGFSLGGAASLLGKRGPLPVDAMILEGVYPDLRHAIYNRLAHRVGNIAASLMEPLLSYQSVLRLGESPEAIAPIRALARVGVPVMVVGAAEDQNTPPADTRAMFHAVRSRRELHIIPAMSHDELGRKMPDDLRDYVLNFFEKNLRRMP
jgi:alpha-beta hydrolase superfamily lysophospholipase